MTSNPDSYADVLGRLRNAFGRPLSDDEIREASEALAAQDRDAQRRAEGGERPRVLCHVLWRQPSAIERGLARLEHRDPPAARRGVTISDEFGGAIYEVVLNDAGDITDLRVIADGRRALSAIRRIPDEQLQATAATFLEVNAWIESFARPDDAADPVPEYVANAIRRADRLGPRASARRALAESTGKSLPTVDRWIRAARTADPTLPQARRNPRGTER